MLAKVDNVLNFFIKACYNFLMTVFYCVFSFSP